MERFAGAVDVAHSTHPLLLPSRHRAVKVVTVYDLDFLDHPGRSRAEIRRDYPTLAARHAQRADLDVVISEHTAREVRGSATTVTSQRFEPTTARVVGRSPSPSTRTKASPA